jgi:hypothetical protein
VVRECGSILQDADLVALNSAHVVGGCVRRSCIRCEEDSPSYAVQMLRGRADKQSQRDAQSCRITCRCLGGLSVMRVEALQPCCTARLRNLS